MSSIILSGMPLESRIYAVHYLIAAHLRYVRQRIHLGENKPSKGHAISPDQLLSREGLVIDYV